MSTSQKREHLISLTTKLDYGLSKLDEYDEFKALIGIEHGPFHQEGDPLIHTKMVCREMYSYIRKPENQIPQERWDYLMVAAAYHDIAKSTTFQMRPDKHTGIPKPTFYGHDLEGYKIIPTLLKDVFNDEFIEKVRLITLFHMTHARPLDQWTDKAVKKMKEKINGHIDGKDLLAIFTCDNLGRIADNIRDIPDLVKEKLKEI